MTDEQFNKLMNVLAAQAALMHGIMNLLQAHNMKTGAGAAALQFKEFQQLLDATAKSVKIPG